MTAKRLIHIMQDAEGRDTIHPADGLGVLHVGDTLYLVRDDDPDIEFGGVAWISDDHSQCTIATKYGSNSHIFVGS